MKKTAYTVLPFFILANAAFLGLGGECLLRLLGLSMAISLDSPPIAEQYPRFIPFCVILGITALVGLIALFILNTVISEKLNYTKTVWILEYILSFALTLPLIKLWNMLFDFLQKVF